MKKKPAGQRGAQPRAALWSVSARLPVVKVTSRAGSCLAMATGEAGDASDGKALAEGRGCDPSLDFLSTDFDPLKALTTAGVRPPVANATTYDNLSKYWQIYNNPNRPAAKAGTSKRDVPKEVPERRWLPHQLPVQNQRTPKYRNVLTRMESVAGPLSVLRKCRDERIRIKVWTRHSHDIRGYCTAFVTAFDKHWNLVLEDVTEVWTRPKRRKVPAGLDAAASGPQPARGRPAPPPVKVVKSDAKTETCQRHVDQFLVRGEQVALIAVLPV